MMIGVQGVDSKTERGQTQPGQGHHSNETADFDISNKYLYNILIELKGAEAEIGKETTSRQDLRKPKD